jgi:hypothetical protein
MSRRGALGLITILLGGLATLGGCASDEKPFLAPSSSGGLAWLVVYRPGVGIGEADIAVDGAASCALPGGSAFARQVKAGRHAVTADNSLAPGLSVLKFDVLDGQTTYVRVAANRGRIARSFIPIYGWVNSFVEAEQNKGKPHGNLFGLDLTAEAAAREEIVGTDEIACLVRHENK